MKSMTVLFQPADERTNYLSSGDIVRNNDGMLTIHMHRQPKYRALRFDRGSKEGALLSRDEGNRIEVEIQEWKVWEHDSEVQLILPNKDSDSRYISRHLMIRGAISSTISENKDEFVVKIDDSTFRLEYDGEWDVKAECTELKWELARPEDRESNTLGFDSPMLHVGTSREIDSIETVIE